MSFLPRFNFTIPMVRNPGTIESARAVIDILPLPPDHVLSLRQAARRRGTRSVYRETGCPVVDSATRRIDYGPPTPHDVPALMRELVVWWQSPAAAELTGPIRAGLLAHRFVSIHPFDDGNGRTARALATSELWRSSCYRG